MGKIKNAFGKLGNVLKGFKTYWNKPPKGRYLSYKEAAAYCVGGMGVVGATVIPTYVTLQAGVYIAAALNIAVDHIVIIGIISNIVNILRAPIYSMLVDNTNTKYGKFRPYLIWMPIPIVVCMFAIGWIPQMLTDHYMVMLVVYTIIFQLLQFFMGLYSLAFTTLLQVITPAQGEKEWLMGIGATVYSLGPSLVNMIIPFIGNLLYTYTLTTGDKMLGIHTLGPFKWVMPIAMILCLALGYWTAFGTKERTATSKQYKQKVNFKHGIVSTAKNKYFWLFTSSSILCTFKLAGTTFVVWLCSYAIQKSWAQSLFVTIMGSACVPGMVLAPLFIKKLGKKNIIIFTNILCVVLTIPLLFVSMSYNAFTPYFIIIISFIITLANSLQLVAAPAIQTQMYDYQQFQTGERQEGFISQCVASLTMAIGIGLSFVNPAIYKLHGFNDDPTVLTNPDVLYGIIATSAILAIVSGILGTIPMFFWDITEKKHACIIETLKVRALAQDGIVDAETATSLEERLMGGDVEALNEYVRETGIGGEDFLSVKDAPDDSIKEADDATVEEVTVDVQESVVDDGENNQ